MQPLYLYFSVVYADNVDIVLDDVRATVVSLSLLVFSFSSELSLTIHTLIFFFEVNPQMDLETSDTQTVSYRPGSSSSWKHKHPVCSLDTDPIFKLREYVQRWFCEQFCKIATIFGAIFLSKCGVPINYMTVRCLLLY